jgi:CRISPR-associated protein Csd1
VEQVGIDCVITPSGEFHKFVCFEKVETRAEALSSKKGKARLLLDKCEEVLGVESKPSKEGFERKHQLFREKLQQFSHIGELGPALYFYENPGPGLETAQRAFVEQVPEKKRIDNIAFRVLGADRRLHEHHDVYKALITLNETNAANSCDQKMCSICGSNKYPVGDIPHGMVKRVPAGQSSGCALVSYNKPAFESYGLTGNNNSSVCSHCANAYVEALNWLLSNGTEVSIEAKKKPKKTFIYSNRKRIGDDSALVFWLKNDVETEILDILDTPSEDSINKLINSPFASLPQNSTETQPFYGITLSGAAARIAVRDWIQTCLHDVKQCINQWFQDVRIFKGSSAGNPAQLFYPSIHALVNAFKREGDTNGQIAGRAGTTLWNTAIRGGALPLWILSSILMRLRAEQGKVTAERAALIKLFLVRNNNIKKGESSMERLDEINKDTAYLCGRLFAVLERLQYHSQGDLNAGIGERFFTAASSTPALAFGRLMKLAKQHLTKLMGEKPGLAVNIDKEIQSILADVHSFPITLRLEEQGMFALGYYHQKNDRRADVSVTN